MSVDTALPDVVRPPSDDVAAGTRARTRGSRSRSRGALRVLDGLQAGARVPLAGIASVSLGAAPDDDIVLRDPGVGAARCALEPRAGATRLHVLAAPVALDGVTLEVGQRVPLPAGARLRLGEVELEIEPAEGGIRAPTDESSAGDADAGPDEDALPTAARPARSHALESAAAARALARSAPPPPATGPRRAARVASIVIGLLGLGGLVAAVSGRLDAPPAPRVPIETALAALPFSALSVTREDGVLGVHGVLPDRAALRELDGLLRANGSAHVNRVETEGTLALKVLDVLRVNGVEATLVETSGADISVSTAVPAERDLDALARAVERDVPSLASLTIDNTPPPEPVPDVPLVTDAGKRVALVVSVPPAHVVTEDRSRYFVGAVLPSGHRIASIVDNRVSLEKDGARTELEF